MKKGKKRFILIVVLFLATIFLMDAKQNNVVQAKELENPRVVGTGSDMVSTWDCVWFGNYYQSDTTGQEKEPIKWRVLSVDGDDAFLLADQNLDSRLYDPGYADVTWKSCYLRSWLNGYGSSENDYGGDYSSNNFIDAAFTSGEQNAILQMTVVNSDNPYRGTPGGENTSDKIYLLSIVEATNAAYGFFDIKGSMSTKISTTTAYAKARGSYTYQNASWWWLRSPGAFNTNAALVNYLGILDSYGLPVSRYFYAVRPALHLDLSSSDVWSYAGTVSSDGTVKEADANQFLPSVNGPSYDNMSLASKYDTVDKGLFEYCFGKSILTDINYQFHHDVKNGLCFGLSTMSGLAYNDLPSATSWSQEPIKTGLVSFDDIVNNKLQMTGVEYIQMLHIAQWTPLLQKETDNNKVVGKNTKLQNIVDVVKSIGSSKKLVIINLQGKTDNKVSGHAVLAYKLEESADGSAKIYIYDSNKPKQDDVYITITKDNSVDYNTWSYYMGTYMGKETYWGTNQDNNYLSYLSYETMEDVYNRLASESGAFSEYSNQYSLLVTNNDEFSLTNENGDTTTYENGTSDESVSGLIEMKTFGMSSGSDTNHMFYVEGSKVVINNKENIENDTVWAKGNKSIEFKTLGSNQISISEGNDIAAKLEQEKQQLFNVEVNNEGIKYTINAKDSTGQSSVLLSESGNVEVSGITSLSAAVDMNDGEKKIETNELSSDQNYEISYKDNEVVVRTDSNGDGNYDKIIETSKNNDESKPIQSNPSTPSQQKISKITISGLSKNIAAGKKIALKANVTPSNATNKGITWKSSNTKVATVSANGVVTVKKKTGGKSVTITATAKDGSGKKATYKIKSMKGIVTKLTVSGAKVVKAGKSIKLNAKVTASKGANKKLKWESSNTKYAVVSSSGKVKTKKAGKGKTVKITVRSTDGSNKSKAIKIKLK